ncbi:hypothetical protein EDB89DRAFT_1912525 [Lactarius sanguifluus]|nr:hypothetical protein EDB89DRAFT_1912525 [Lactarius sanguifluus]
MAPMRRGSAEHGGWRWPCRRHGGGGGRVETAPVEWGQVPQDGNNRDGDNEAAYTRVPVSGRLGRLGARKGARMPQGVRAVGGGLDDEGNTVPRPAQVRDEREKRKEKTYCSFVFV